MDVVRKKILIYLEDYERCTFHNRSHSLDYPVDFSDTRGRWDGVPYSILFTCIELLKSED